MKKIIILLLALAFYADIYALNKVRWKQMDWEIYDTDHFKIYYYKGAELLAKTTAIYAEQAFVKDTAILKYEATGQIPLFIYENKLDFTSTNITLSVLGEGTGGFTEAYKNRVVLPGTGSLKQLREVITHEIAHALQFSIIYGDGMRSYNVVYKSLFLPTWVMEGMAEYCADDFDSQGEMVLRDAVINDRLIPLDRMEGFEHLDEVYLAYKEAQSVFMYLVGKYGPDTISEFVKVTADEFGLDNVLKKVVRTDYDTFIKDWSYYLKKKYWAQVQGRDTPDKYGPRLTKNSHSSITYDQAPVFSPDGTRIAFVSSRGGHRELYIMDQDGRNAVRMFNAHDSLSTDGHPLSWSRDGKYVYYAATERGKRYIFKGHTGTGVSERIDLNGYYDIYSPAVSPDGNYLAFTATQDGFSDIYVVDLRSGAVRNMTNNMYENNYPAWSPDQSSIIFTEERDDYSRLAVIDVSTGEKKFPGVPEKYDCRFPLYKNDKEVLFTADKSGIFNLYSMDIATGAQKQLTNIISGVMYPSYCNGQVVYSYFEDACENIYKFLDDRDRDIREIPAGYDPGRAARDAESAMKAPEPAAVKAAAVPDDTQFRESIEKKAAELIRKQSPYITTITPDLLFAVFGYGTDTGMVGSGYISASDMLGDHNMALLANFVPGYIAQFDLQYVYMGLPFDLGLGLFYYRNVYQIYDSATNLFFSRLDTTQVGGTLSMKYALNLYTSFTLSLQTTSVTDKYTNYETQNSYIFDGTGVPQTLNLAGLLFKYEHSAWRDLWPYSGEEAAIYAETADRIFGGTKSYNLYEMELKKYFDLSGASGYNVSLSMRLLLAATDGPDRPMFLFGGMNTLRGLGYGEYTGDRIGLFNTELRYPLARNINFKLWPFSFIMIKNLKLALFDDCGLARTGEISDLTAEELKNGMGVSFIIDAFLFQQQYLPLKFEVARRTDIADDKWKFYFSIATNF
ncbi:MAG: hypothetical protein LLG37_00760 [Spirochaetia bacterium]|nr:hypothetical protein [Spirochaetia bacterium]